MVTSTFRPRLPELDHDPRDKNDPLLLGCPPTNLVFVSGNVGASTGTSIPKLIFIIGESYREDLANGSVGEMAPAISGVPDRSTAHNLFKALADVRIKASDNYDKYCS
ncbi:hypothetical protein COP2_024579 [Malus domestica]